MRGVSANGRQYYRDVSQIEHTGNCPQAHVRAADIENEIVTLLLQAASNPDLEARMQAAQIQIEQAHARAQRAGELYLNCLFRTSCPG